MEKFDSVSFKPSSNNDDMTSTQHADGTKDEDKDHLIQDFGSYTTLHGFHFTLDSKSRWRRFIWMFLIIFGFGFFFVQVWQNLTKLNANEVVISKSVEFAQTLSFPAVTICNQNMMRKSKIEGTIAQDYLDQMDKIKSIITGQKPKDVPSFDVGKTLQNAGHQIQDMIHHCEFAGVSCSNINDFTPAIPSFLHGLCYTFTSNTSRLKKVGSGKNEGLQIRLNAEPNEYYGPFSYDATGFKIAVHEPGTYHDIENKGQDVSPGFHTSIRIKRKKMIAKPPPYPSKCGSKKLHNFERYTQKACLFEYWSKDVIEECNCRVLGMVEKGIKHVKFCNSTERSKCITPASKRFRDTAESRGCPMECESIEYTVRTSLAYFPSESLWRVIIPALLGNTTTLNVSNPEDMAKIQTLERKQLASVTIFFEDLSTDVTEEKSTYDISAFASDIGGSMGLFLGCSLLTICEFIDLLVMVCLHRWRKISTKIDGN